MSSNAITIRSATEADIPVLVDYRIRMFLEAGWQGEERAREVGELFAEFFLNGLEQGVCHAWIAEAEGIAVGGVGLMWETIPPSVRNPSGRQAYVFGIFVEPGFRRRGIAKRLVKTTVDYATAHGCAAISLHASDAGRPVYEKMGFTDSSELRFFTEHANLAEWHPEDRQP